MDLQNLSKEELINMVKELREELVTKRYATQEELDYMEEESLKNQSYMESHGRVDYGYGCGVYGAL